MKTLIDRFKRDQGWQVAALFAAFLAIAALTPDDGCYVDWDGRSNPTVCDK